MTQAQLPTGFRAVRPGHSPSGRSPAVAAVADQARVALIGAVLLLLIFGGYGALRGDVLPGLVFGLVAAGIIGGAVLRTRLTAGSDWLELRLLLGTRWVELDHLTSVQLRKAVSGQKVVLTDSAAHTVTVKLELLLADPRIRATVHDGLKRSGLHTDDARSLLAKAAA